MFQAFQSKEFQFFLQYYQSMKLITGIYKNISKYGQHQEASKTPVLPCLNVIEWMTWRINHESRIILNFEGKHVATYQGPILKKLY
jgi:hypothetical protein